MKKKTKEFLEKNVLSVLQNEFPDILPELILLSGGSTGLGCDDKYSDIEAFLYMPDKEWSNYGWKIQIALNKCLRENNTWKKNGSAICVEEFHDLLNNQAKAIINGNKEVYWDKIDLHDLYNIQKQTAIHDPKEILKKLKKATAPDVIPQVLWKKWLTEALNQFYNYDFLL